VIFNGDARADGVAAVRTSTAFGLECSLPRYETPTAAFAIIIDIAVMSGGRLRF